MPDPWNDMPDEWNPTSRFDGGDTGCGEMILNLRMHFQPLPGGTRVVIRALDEGAPIEIPAWCRITRHELLEARHPLYLLRKRRIEP